MPSRTLNVALWDYRDDHGRKHRAHYGQTFELPDSEAQRGERASVFTESKADDTDAVPPKTSAKPVLVAWLVEHRDEDEDRLASLTKPELWQRIEQP